jgi:hypothetical protein
MVVPRQPMPQPMPPELRRVIMARKSRRDRERISSAAKSPTAPTKSSEQTPAKFTAESLRAHGFKVPEPRGRGYVIGAPGRTTSKP